MPVARRQSTVHQLPPGEPEGEGELGIGAYFAPRAEHCLMSWEHIQRVVAQDDLDYLVRHPECEGRYIEWANGIRAHYGGLESYVRQVRLGWTEEGENGQSVRAGGTGGDNEQPVRSSGTNGSASINHDADVDSSTFFSQVVANDPNLVKAIPNDWPYAMPAECGHSVIWCKVPILDSVLFAGKDTPFPAGPVREAVFKAIEVDGIRGLSGNGTHIALVGLKTKGLLSSSPDVMDWISATANSKVDVEENVTMVAEKAQRWAGRFIDTYVKERWPEPDWETAYFCNPPHLRTVPGLSHFHVIVRRKAGNPVIE